MSVFENQLLKLEQRLQNLIEGSVERLFTSDQTQIDLANQLAGAMRECMRQDAAGVLVPPDLFTIRIDPAQADYINSNPELIDELANHLQRASEDTDLVFLTAPAIRVQGDNTLKPGQLQVTAHYSQDELGDTMDYKIEAESEAQAGIPSNAFLIVDGTQVFPLEENLVKIGRRGDNHLVIDDPRISRRHAQLRTIDGRYVIFDLESTGGTWVNGQRIQKSALQPGDVISLSGLPLVYGQDSLEPGDTQKYSLSISEPKDETDSEPDSPGSRA